MSSFLAQPVILIEPMQDGRASAALVTKVWNPDYVNLAVFPENGPSYVVVSVPYFGIDQVVPDGFTAPYCVPAGWE